MSKENLKVLSEQTIEQNPSKFKSMVDKFAAAIKNPGTIINLIQGIGAVPAAVGTVGSILAGNIPVAVGAVVIVLGALITILFIRKKKLKAKN